VTSEPSIDGVRKSTHGPLSLVLAGCLSDSSTHSLMFLQL